MDKSGPVATHESAAKLDTMRITEGVIFNSRLSLSTVATERDLSKWASLLRGHFDLGWLEVSYMVVGKEVLLDAQKRPEKYPGLVVRVAGYSAFFVEVSKEVHGTIIDRVEHTW